MPTTNATTTNAPAPPAPASADERTVERTYRAAIKLGEGDYITLEEVVRLPLTASDAEITQAVDLGWRIFQAQQSAVLAQVADIRAGAPIAQRAITVKDPDEPASDKQRNYIGVLQDQLGWSNEQLDTYAAEQGVIFATMTKGQASSFIDGLKKLADGSTSTITPGKALTGSTGFTPAAPQAPPEEDDQDIPF